MTTTNLQTPRTSRVRLFRLSVTALLSALGFILMFIEFPLLPMFAYLKMDFSDLPAILGGVLLGPVYGVIIELVKNLLDLLFKGFGSQMGFGNFQNFLVGSAFVLPLSICLRRFVTPEGYGGKGLALGCGLGSLSLLAVGFLSNLLVAPLYFRFFVGETIPLSGALTAAGAASLFNVIKGAILVVIVLAGARFALPPLKKMVDKVR
ncbi:MAG: ECF transporter S component [Clostridiales bacterium]|nr:ECF transporter S component [Clostridiales bacterium]